MRRRIQRDAETQLNDLREGISDSCPPEPPRFITHPKKTFDETRENIQRRAAKMVHSVRGGIPSRAVLLSYILQTIREVKKRKVNFILGTLSCFLVVVVVSLLLTLLANAPIVFLRLAELNAGEIDVKMWSGEWTGYTKVNYTLTAETLGGSEDRSYHSPRYHNEVALIPPSFCTGGDDPNFDPYSGVNCTASEPGSCFAAKCGTTAFKGVLYLIDFKKEDRMGVGREWDLNDPPKVGYAYIDSSIADQVGVSSKQGSNLVWMSFDISQYFSGLYQEIMIPPANSSSNATSNSTTSQNVFIQAIIPVHIQTTFSDPAGKTPADEDNSIMMDYNTFLGYLSNYMHPNISDELREQWRTTNLYHYAQDMILNLPPPRTDAYLKSDYDSIRKEVVEFASDVLYKVGFNQLDSELPVLSELGDTRFFSLFLTLILNIVIIILLVLSILLIYSLLMVNVETRTFEMGVMRMVGTTRPGIVQLLIIQAFSYAVPAWVVGLIIGQLLMVVASYVFDNLTGVPIPWELTYEAVLVATALGIAIPILSAVLPIRQALGVNLHDALDIKRPRVQAVSVKLERSEDRNFSWSIVVVGAALALFGFTIYYVFPLALLTLNLTLLLNIFFLLLMGMLLGLVLLSLNLEHLLERMIITFLLFWEKQAVRAVVRKNLIAHRRRNRKTTIMFALSLGFIIFIMVSYSTTITSFIYATQQSHGCYLWVRGSGDTDTSGNVRAIRNIYGLEHIGKTDKSIKSFSWITQPWESSVTGAQASAGAPAIYNVGRTFFDVQHMYAIAPNFYDVALSGFLNEGTSPGHPGGMDVGEQLYTAKGSSSALVGTVYEDVVGLESLDTDFVWRFEVDRESQKYVSLVRMKPLALLDSSPVFRFSKYPSVRRQDTVVSMPTMLRMLQRGSGAPGSDPNGVPIHKYESIEELPMRYFLIELKDGASGGDIDRIKSKLGRAIVGEDGVEVWDYRDTVGPIESAQSILTYFFAFVTAVAMLIASFSLVSSMYTNVYEQTKEIGILRAIGIPKMWMRRIYVWEAFTLVLASSLLGVIIGSVVGYTLTLQRVLFTQLPIPFVFPWEILLMVLAGSLVFALASSLGPVHGVMRKPVVYLMRFAGV